MIMIQEGSRQSRDAIDDFLQCEKFCGRIPLTFSDIKYIHTAVVRGLNGIHTTDQQRSYE